MNLLCDLHKKQFQLLFSLSDSLFVGIFQWSGFSVLLSTLELVGSDHAMSQYFSLVLPSSNVELVALKMSVLMKMQVKRILLETVQIIC